jgi:hypothetical protein
VSQPPVYLTLKGIPTDAPEPNDLFFWFDPPGTWRPSRDDLSGEVELECVRLHDATAEAIFGDIRIYHALLPGAPDFVFTAGLNSESTLSRTDFERFIRSSRDPATLNKLLYLADCWKLVASILECTKEVLLLQGEFYRALNLDPLFYPPVEEPDGIRWMTSAVVTNLHATLSFIFIRLHSLLDYTTKLAFEVDHMQTDFSSSPRLASSNVVFGDRKRLTLNAGPGTLFESCDFEARDVVAETELYRNHIIHDGLLDDIPNTHKVIEDGKVVEKFALLPDRGPEGRFEKYMNRNLFYSREDRVNLRLPSLITGFQARQVATLVGISGILRK